MHNATAWICGYQAEYDGGEDALAVGADGAGQGEGWQGGSGRRRPATSSDAPAPGRVGQLVEVAELFLNI